MKSLLPCRSVISKVTNGLIDLCQNCEETSSRRREIIILYRPAASLLFGIQLKVEKLTHAKKLVTLLISCNRANNITTGKQLHAIIVKSGHLLYPPIASSLTDLYSKCGLLRESRSVFEAINLKDAVLWNVMVSSHAFNGYEEDAYKVFELMRLQGFTGDGFTLSVLLNSCGSLACLALGQQTHGLVEKMCLLDADVVVCSSLVDMYAKCAAIDDARKVFDAMKARNVVSWNAMIVGYGHCGQGEEAMKLLADMIRGFCKPDELTLSSVLSSCAGLASSIGSKQVHGFAVKSGLQAFISVGNALIISYAKSGSIEDAYRCFCSVSEPNLVTWTSMICSFAFHGFAEGAIALFERMLRGGGRPDSVVFVGVLSACSHAGFVGAGLAYFESMVKGYKIDAREEHYSCLVDLLGRAGHVYEAYDVMSQMPFKPNADVLGAFLGGCKVHGKAELAKWAAAKLFGMEPAEPANYKSMSNIYASGRVWEGVAKMRRAMKENCGKQVRGCCWVEINGGVHTFLSDDKSHPEAIGIYWTLEILIKLMKDECMAFRCQGI